jgi:acetyl esterase
MMDIAAHTVRDPRFAPETSALLERLGHETGPITYDDLVAGRAAPPDPELAGRPEPVRVQTDLVLPHGETPIRVRLYRDHLDAPRPLLLWLHGGGFVGGSLADVDVVCSALARRTGVNVVSLDYRLAPEHPFPAALHDTYDALCWLAANGAAIGGDGRVAAGGQSAGANLVAAACLLARDRGGPRVARQILCYPVLDFVRDSESHRLFDGVFLSSELQEWYDAQYLGGQPITPYAAPLRAETPVGLPPALVLGAGRDPLRDEAREYAGRLDRAGVDVAYREYADTMHAFLNFPGALSAGRRAIQDIADDLGRSLGQAITSGSANR